MESRRNSSGTSSQDSIRCSAAVKSAMDIKIPGVRKLREDRTGQPVVGSGPRTASDYYHEQSIESSFSARYSKWDDNKAWSPSRVEN